MKIKILGSGCAKCNQLYRIVQNVVYEMKVEAEVVKEEDIMEIMKYGIMRTPGMVINEKVVVSGKIPTNDEIKTYITENL